MPILAYIDPGSGSLLLQAIVAAALAVPYFFRQQIGGIWRRIRGRPERTEGSDSSKS